MISRQQEGRGRSAGLVHALISLAFLTVLAQPEVTRAQWTTTGNTVHPTDPAKTVGVGTTAAANKLEVVDSSANTGTLADAASFPLALENSNQTNNNTVGINFRSRTNTGTLYGIGGIALRSTSHTAGAYNSDIEFYNRNINSISTPFIIKSNGNVGVGTTAPTSRLEVTAAPTAHSQPIITVTNPTGFHALGLALNSTGAGNTNFGFQAGGVTKGAVGWSVSENSLFLWNAVASPNYASMKVLPDGGVGLYNMSSGGENVRFTPSGSVGIGTPAPLARLHVMGDVIVDGNISAKFQDVAEWVPSRQRLAAGTVVVLDTTASNHVVASTAAYDTGVAGVVSGQPGLILGEGGEGKVMVATTGRVRVKVDATRAPVKIGDLLVTGDTPGVAMKSEPITVGGRKMHAPGTIVGKALEPLAGGVGEILVLLSLQ